MMLWDIVVSVFFVLLHLGTAWRVAPLMPERMRTHWGLPMDVFDNADRRTNSYMNKRAALSIGPLTSVVISLIFVLVHKKSSANFEPVLVMLFVQIVLYLVIAGVLYRGNMNR